MFELILNAVKIAFSKDARDGTNALIDALVKSPEWQQEICTCVARLPAGEVERVALLLDVISSKLAGMSYDRESVTAFRTATRELVTNAIEHGCNGDPKERIGITVEVSPTYVSSTIANPKSAPVELHDWARQGFLRLHSSGKRSRGRGLQLVSGLADMVQQVDAHSIKAVIYRNRVVIVHEIMDQQHVVAVTRGHSNPSLLRRLTKFIENRRFDSLVLCLDPREFEWLSTKRVPLRDVPTKEEEEESTRDAYFDDMESSVTHFITNHFERSGTTFRIVMRDSPYLELMAEGVAFRHLKDAVASLKDRA